MIYKNKYRTQSTRLQGWDYRSPGLYYITICTKNMKSRFGDIVDDNMVLNDIGGIAFDYWKEIPHHHDKIDIDEFIVMPNHIHGIVWIQQSKNKGSRDVACNVSTPSNELSKISPKKSSLSSIIRSYKSAVTRHIRKDNPAFAWQPRYYDHIIRDESGLENIRHYIINNPLNWKKDHHLNDKIFIRQLSTSKKPRPLFMN